MNANQSPIIIGIIPLIFDVDENHSATPFFKQVLVSFDVYKRKNKQFVVNTFCQPNKVGLIIVLTFGIPK
jgi:hypothetical protein